MREESDTTGEVEQEWPDRKLLIFREVIADNFIRVMR